MEKGHVVNVGSVNKTLEPLTKLRRRPSHGMEVMDRVSERGRPISRGDFLKQILILTHEYT